MPSDKIFPYTCIIIDATWTDFLTVTRECVYSSQQRALVVEKLQKLWTTPQNQNRVLPCLSVRSALDMYLRLMNFPEGSEVIMSAINIPDMCFIVHHHKLKIVSLDINIDDTSPKVESFEALVTPRTKLVIVTHIYGKWFDVNPLMDLAEKHGIPVLEDCAEGFHGLSCIGNPRCDMNLFSFGGIKYATSFGGAIAKVKDEDLYNEMKRMQDGYPHQSHAEYFKKVLKYAVVRLLCQTTPVTRTVLGIARDTNYDQEIQKLIVALVRGFPNQLVLKLRHQPSTALLAMMLRRHSNFKPAHNLSSIMKGEYIAERLPEGASVVGQNASINNYWLFPIIVDQPDEVVRMLHSMGVYAYRGATQLNLVESDVMPYNEECSTSDDRDVSTDDKHDISRTRDISTDDKHDISRTRDISTPIGNNTSYGVKPKQSQIDKYHAAFGKFLSNENGTKIAKKVDFTGSSSRVEKCHANLTNNENGERKLNGQVDESQTKHLKKYFQCFPHEAKYLMDNVVYLPVNKTVPFTELDHLAECVTTAVEKSLLGKGAPNTGFRPKLKSNL